MSMFDFPEEQTCPQCQKTFLQAEHCQEYSPIVVVRCPHCSTMLWRPGLDASSRLFVFDPDADEGGI